MKRSLYRWLASSALAALLALSLHAAATRPHYGGTLRVEMRAAMETLDPTVDFIYPPLSAARDRLSLLVFDRLVRLDERGAAHPQLASAWQHSGDYRRWQFWLQRDVKLHDGTPLTLWHLSTSLMAANPDWDARVLGDSVVIEFNQPRPNLLAELAQARNAVVVRKEGEMVGTGPFRVREFTAGKRAVFTANADYWGGRPYVEQVEIEMGRASRQQAIDLELGRADLVEVALEEVRRLRQERRTVAVSAPAELMALQFVRERPAVADAGLRQAVTLSLDRGSMQAVLLQGQGEIARGLLPQWMSGYSFLFPAQADVEQARQLRAQLGNTPALTLAYDGGDPLARAVAERVAVNAREAGITIRAFAEKMSARPGEADIRLVRLRLPSTEPAAALAGIAAALDLPEPALTPDSAPREWYEAERRMLEEFRIAPLLHLPEAHGLSPRVRNWPRSGGWPLEDLWLETTL